MPVYYDVESFRMLRADIRSVLGNELSDRDLEARLVALDDSAGRDPAMAELQALDDVHVVEPPFNLGHQRGLVYALRKMAPEMADDDLVVTLDSDGEDQASDLPRLLEPLWSGTSPEPVVVLARRTSRQTSLRFKFLYAGFRLMFRALTGATVRSGNFAAYRGRVAKRLFTHPAFDLSYSATFLGLGLPVAYVPCDRGRRYAGESRMSSSQLLIHGLRMMMPFADQIAMRALVLFALTLAASVALAAGVLGIRLFTDEAIPGWATFTLLSVVILSIVAAGNFVTLFTVFSQSRAISLADLESEEL